MKSHGIFNIDSMITYFFSNDNHASHSPNHLSAIDEILESTYAKLNKQTYTLLNIYALEKEIQINVFHELTHSWQALSSPMIILNFLNITKKLRANAKKFNLYLPRISNTYLFMDDDDPNIDFAYKSHRMNFIQKNNGRRLFNHIRNIYQKWQEQGNTATWKDFTRTLKSKLETHFQKNIYEIVAPELDMVHNPYDIVSIAPPLAIPLMIYEHEEEGKYFAGSGALIDYFDMVYFTGDNLMEAFATVNDYLRKNEAIPTYDSLKAEDNMYLGVYEAYRRIHQERYDTEKELALSFLALVDLAFLNDPFGIHTEIYEYDNSFRNENVSLPYRFKNLIYKAQGFRTFEIEDNDIATSLKEWQDDYCRYLGYFSPNDGIRNMICYLLSVIMDDANGKYLFTDYDKKENTITEMLQNKDNWNECLEYLLNEINEMYRQLNGKKITSQHHLLVMIVNALLFRLKHRGEMVAPCYYNELISQSFESTLYIYNGEYYGNILYNYNLMPLKHIDIGHYSLLDLMVLQPLAKESRYSCGFLSSFIPCRFQYNGMGCPLIGLTNQEKEYRKSIGLNPDWCHHKCVMNELDKDIKYQEPTEM